MNDEVKKYPFNRIACIWFKQWRNAIREAKASPDESYQSVFCRRAALCQANYIIAVITGDK